MKEFLIAEWKPIVYGLIVIIYVLVRLYLEKRMVKKRPMSNEEYIFRIARKNECSEFDIFKLSAEEWQVSDKKIHHDFKGYLLRGDIPFYVMDYVRKTREKEKIDPVQPYSPRGGHPPWFA